VLTGCGVAVIRGWGAGKKICCLTVDELTEKGRWGLLVGDCRSRKRSKKRIAKGEGNFGDWLAVSGGREIRRWVYLCSHYVEEINLYYLVYRWIGIVIYKIICNWIG